MADNQALNDEEESQQRFEAEAFSAAGQKDWGRAYSLLASLGESDQHLSAPALQTLAFSAFKTGRIPEACRFMEKAFAGSAEGNQPRDAAKVASNLISLYELLGADAACQAWEQRGLRLIEDLEPCVERGYLALAWTGCSSTTRSILRRGRNLLCVSPSSLRTRT